MTEPQTQAEWIDLLSERIAESELSARQFALRVLLRDEVTVRRWLGARASLVGLNIVVPLDAFIPCALLT